MSDHKRTCEFCQHAEHELDGEYGEIDCGWRCDLKETESDATEPNATCDKWRLAIWHSSFVYDINFNVDSTDEIDQQIEEASKGYWKTKDGIK